MTSENHNGCRHYPCPDCDWGWWPYCPDWDPEKRDLRSDQVQEYADKFRAGAGCDNCVWLATQVCNTCSHLSGWVPVDAVSQFEDLFSLGDEYPF